MNKLIPKFPTEIINDIICPKDCFPNNSQLPLLIYKRVFHFTNPDAQTIQKLLKENNWVNSWVDQIYNYDHYHSTTHEALVIMEGTCKVQIGGNEGTFYTLDKGDVIVIPAGVSHKSITSSDDFKCVGSYPEGHKPDMNYGKAEEHPTVDIHIKKVPLPDSDPIFGLKGPLLDYWK